MKNLKKNIVSIILLLTMVFTNVVALGESIDIGQNIKVEYKDENTKIIVSGEEDSYVTISIRDDHRYFYFDEGKIGSEKSLEFKTNLEEGKYVARVRIADEMKEFPLNVANKGQDNKANIDISIDSNKGKVSIAIKTEKNKAVTITIADKEGKKLHYIDEAKSDSKGLVSFNTSLDLGEYVLKVGVGGTIKEEGFLVTNAGEVENPTKVDRSKLEDKIKDLKSLDSKKYTKESFEALKKAIKSGEEVLRADDISQLEINNALGKLKKAEKNLILKGDSGDKPGGDGSLDKKIKVSIDVQTVGSKNYEVEDNMTALELLTKYLDSKNINYNIIDGEYGKYISMINNISEFDKGPDSGWMYKVNGKFPMYTIEDYVLKDGDQLKLLYTGDLGKDIGAEIPSEVGSGGSGESGSGSRVKDSDKKEDKKNKDKNTDKTNKDGEKLNIVFNDMAKYKWAEKEVAELVEKGIIKGRDDGSFGPSEEVTREDLVVMIVRAMDYKSKESIQNPFKDLREGKYYYKPVLLAYENKIIDGLEKDFFGVGKKATREQVSKILGDVLLESGYTLPENLEGFENFIDRDQISSWAESYVKLMVKEGILLGDNMKKLNPKDNISRLETVLVIQRVLNKL